jgi:hypothetical protein
MVTLYICSYTADAGNKVSTKIWNLCWVWWCTFSSLCQVLKTLVTALVGVTFALLELEVNVK